jgi:N-ethylmaleimide reductase
MSSTPELQMMSPITIGGQELKNRIVLAPMTRARCTPTEDPLDPANTNPNDLMVEYYTQRASGGLIISEATAISELGSGWLNAPHIRTADNVAGWKKVVDSVHAAGGLMYLQLWHMGRQSHSSYHPSTNDIVAPSAIKINGQGKNNKNEAVEPETPRAMSVEDIKETIQDYVRATRLAKEAGFDGVEIHAANGYLIDCFLQSSTNKRTDEYGGSMENRVRFLQEIVEALIEDGSYPADRIGFRISPNGAYGDMGSEDNHVMFPFVAKTMSKYGLAYLHLMDGLGFGYHEKCKPVTAFDIKREFNGPVICNVGLTKETGEGMIRSGAADMVCYGRPYISNPDLPERFKNNWPLNPDPEYEAWWRPTGAVGYTDFPFYKKE